MDTYPYGYGSTQLTLAQYVTKATVYRLHPEFWRRTRALMVAAGEAGVPLGVGTGWRVQPNPPPPGFAQPGNSNHEGFPIGPTSTGAVAADMVPSASWPWMEANVSRFGLRTFKHVNGEPWHIQPAEIPANRNWRTAPWDLARFPLPGDVPPPVQPPPDTTPFPEDDDMAVEYLYRDTRYWDVFLVSAEGAQPVSGVVLEALRAKGVPLYEEAHDPSLNAVLRKLGISHANLTHV